MAYPKDPQNWTERHLEAALQARALAFERYERRVDLDNREATDKLYAEYLRRDTLVSDMLRIVRG